MIAPRLTRFALLLCALAAGACGDAGSAPAPSSPDEEGPVHIHGLGVNPADGALFIATHTGLWRAPAGSGRAERVGEDHKDVMGFTVVGADRFLGSGHPDPREELPPLLGLISSEDAGRTWQPVSLLGEADFHVLRASGDTIYGFDSSGGRLMVSRDGGESWSERRPPGAILDLAIDPRSPARVVASGVDGVHESADHGRTWRRRGSMPPGLLAWTPQRLVVVDLGGTAWLSRDGGRGFTRTGAIGGEPAALAADGQAVLVALHDGTVRRSTDGGRTWRTIVQP